MNRLFITLIFPQKTAVFQLSLNPSLKTGFTLLSSHGFPLLSPAVPHLKLNGSCCGKSSWPYKYPISQNLQDGKNNKMHANCNEKLGRSAGERKQQLTGEQSTIPAIPLSPTAEKKWCIALPLLSQVWLVPLQYLHVDKCSRAIHCLCLLKGRETDVAGQQLLYQSFRMTCLLWQATLARKCSSDNSNPHLSTPKAEDAHLTEHPLIST